MILAAGHIVTRSAFLATAYFLSSSPVLFQPQSTFSKSHHHGEAEDHPARSNDEWGRHYHDGGSSSTTLFVAEDTPLAGRVINDDQYASIVSNLRATFSTALDNDPSLAGPFIRLAFHDATTWERTSTAGDKKSEPILVTTGGPNGSIRYELGWSENRALSKPLAIVEQAWQQQQQQDKTTGRKEPEITISLADAIALAGATAVEHAGGPRITLRMGRPDATQPDPYQLRQPLAMTTERSKVTSTMPSAALDSDGLRLYFGQRLNLQEEEFVALSGVHGLGRHVTLLGMDKSCLKNLTRTCLEEAPQSLPFVTTSVDRFSNAYFAFLLKWYDREIQLGDVAFIPTDVALVVDPGLRKHVQRFAQDERRFSQVFVRAYQKLVETTATTPQRY